MTDIPVLPSEKTDSDPKPLTPSSQPILSELSHIHSKIDRIVSLATLVVYSSLLIVLIAYHEPWLDEAQAWLLARDASLWELLHTYLRFEGHPPLWYLILMIPAKLGAPFLTIHVVSALAAIWAVYLLVRMKNIPLSIRAILPFTYFFLYQYSVVARSYVLYLPLFLLLSRVYHDRSKYLGRFTIYLGLIGMVSVHGMFFASAIYGLYMFESILSWRQTTLEQRRRKMLWLAVFVIDMIFLILVLYPPKDMLYSQRAGFDVTAQKIILEFWYGYFKDFCGNIGLDFILQLTLMIWCYRRKMLLPCLIAYLSICPINAIYFRYWHEGIAVLIFVFVMLSGYQSVSYRFSRFAKQLELIFQIIACIAMLAQCVWSLNAASYDIKNSYSGARAAANYIKAHHLEAKKIAGINFQCIALNAFFDHNIYVNYDINGKAFWDWSQKCPWPYYYTTSEAQWIEKTVKSALSYHPDVIVAGLKKESDYKMVQVILDHSHYRVIYQADGSLFFKNRIIETDIFVLLSPLKSK